jgi:hypothetical protein
VETAKITRFWDLRSKRRSPAFMIGTPGLFRLARSHASVTSPSRQA